VTLGPAAAAAQNAIGTPMFSEPDPTIEFSARPTRRKQAPQQCQFVFTGVASHD
jgi:hypothetical protein